MATTVDFVADFSAPTDGSNCSVAVTAFNTYFATHNDVILNIPAHTYNTSGASIVGRTAATPSTLVINATGASFGVIGGSWGFGSEIAQQTVGHEARINTVSAGSTTVTLVTAGERTRFAVGRWVIVASLDVGQNGQPSGQQIFEYAKVSNIAVDGTITFESALRFGHKSTYPLYYDGQPFEVDMGGPATIYDMPATWDVDLTINGLTIDNPSSILYSKCRSVTWNGCTCSSSFGISPTVNKSHTWINCNFSNCSVEMDKLIDSFTVTGGSVYQLNIQSSCINTTAISGLTCTVGIIGTGRVTTLANSTIPQFRVGPQTNGISETISISSCAIASREASDVFIDPSYLTWMGGGTFRCTTANASVSGLRRAAVPGHKYRFAYYDGEIHDVDTLGGRVIFKVLDVRQDATYVYMDTDLASVPVFSYFGNLANQYVAYPATTITQSGGGLDMTVFAAPPDVVTPFRLRLHR